MVERHKYVVDDVDGCFFLFLVDNSFDLLVENLVVSLLLSKIHVLELAELHLSQFSNFVNGVIILLVQCFEFSYLRLGCLHLKDDLEFLLS